MKTLADRAQAFLANPWHDIPAFKGVADAEVRAERGRLRAARRFTLSDDFVRDAVRAASVQPETLIQRAYLANLPFDSIWVEWDQDVRLDAQVTLGTTRARERLNVGKAGVLIRRLGASPDSWIANDYADYEDGSAGAMLGLAAQILFPIADLPRNRAKVLELFTDGSTVGSTVSTGWGYLPTGAMTPERTEEYRGLLNELVARGSTVPERVFSQPALDRMAPGSSDHHQLYEGFEISAREARGQLRFLITVLAMLNHAPVRYEHVKPTGRFTRRLNSMEYLDSHVVTIHAGRQSVVRLLDKAAKAEAKGRRRHEVRGHWRLERGKGLPGCRHLPISTDGERGTCSLCGGTIYWLDSHMRGDASLGFVRKEYEVER